MAELLRAENVSEVFGGLKAVSDFNFYIKKGELVGLIGPNGAGKTTAFNLFTGVYEPTTGSIDFDGRSIVGLKPYQITQRGIARTFQNIRLFSELSVLDNVKIAYHSHVKYTVAEAVIRLGRYFKEEKEYLQLLKDIRHCLVMADEDTVAQADMTNFKVCVSHPCYSHRTIVKHLPFMGERGADMLFEYIQQYVNM